MSELTTRVEPGYQLAANEKLTVDIINAIARPEVYIEGLVGGAAIDDGAVTEAKLADASVTAAKLNPDVAGDGITLDATDGLSVDWATAPDIETVAAVVAASKNLLVRTDTTHPTYVVRIWGDEVVLKTADGAPYLARAATHTEMASGGAGVAADVTGSGAGGLDTGTEDGNGASVWYYIYLIYNPTTAAVAGLLSVSATAPTLPADYTYYALLGAVYNDSGKDFEVFRQQGDRVWCASVAGATGAHGTSETNLGAGSSLATIVPPTARTAFGWAKRASSGDVVYDTVLVIAGDTGATMGPVRLFGGTWEVPLVTAQTIFYYSAGSSAEIYVNGWSY